MYLPISINNFQYTWMIGIDGTFNTDTSRVEMMIKLQLIYKHLRHILSEETEAYIPRISTSDGLVSFVCLSPFLQPLSLSHSLFPILFTLPNKSSYVAWDAL